MTHINPKSNIVKIVPKKRRGVAEVISTLLLVVITVVGAIILTTFIDESFVAGSQSIISSTDSTVKTIKLRGYDTRNGDDLMSTSYGLHNTGVPNVLCRATCAGDPNEAPSTGGSDFVVIQIQNRSIDSIFLKNIYLDNVNHPWDADTFNVLLNGGAPDSSGGAYPTDGRFSVLSDLTTDLVQKSNEVKGGATANLLIKLDTTNADLELSKTVRVEVNLGQNKLSNFLIETGDAR